MPEDRRRPFGEALRTAREGRGLSQVQFAALLGVAQSAVSGWEGGVKEPAPETVFAIEDALGCPDLLAWHLGYVRAGGDHPPSVNAADAIHADPSLGELARRALLALYRELREED